MTRNLRDELSALADEGVGRMAAADDLAAVMTSRFAHARRRRPVIVAGATCLVLATAGAAAAGVTLLRGEVTELPDRITAGAAGPSAPTGLRCGRELGDVWPTWEPLLLRDNVDESASVSVSDVSSDEPGVVYPGDVSLDSASTVDLVVTRGEIAGLYLVRDGMVVAQPGPVGTTVDETIEHGSGVSVRFDRPTMCDGTPAPDGTYEAYGSLEVTVHGGDSAGTYDIVGGPWTVEIGPPVAPPVEPEQPGIPGLTSVDTGATSPWQCGAQVGFSEVGAGAWASGSDSRSFGPQIGWTDVDDPAGTAVATDGTSTISLRTEVVGGAAAGFPTTAPAVVIVTDGVVVGTASPDGPVAVAATEPTDLDSRAPVTGVVRYRACSGGSSDAGLLPAGHYSIWVVQGYRLVERSEGAGASAGRVVDEDVTAYGRAADLWIGADGRPVPGPAPAQGWPVPVPAEAVVSSSGAGTERSVVWFDASDGSDPLDLVWRTHTQDALADAGYDSAAFPVACQPRAQAVLNLPVGSTDATGVGVVFATRAEADAFVELFGSRGGVVVQGEMVACS